MQERSNLFFSRTIVSSICKTRVRVAIFSDSWTQESVDRLLATFHGTIGVGTARNMKVPGTVEIAQQALLEDTTLWDQVNECSIDIPSGRLVVAGCTDYFPDAARIELPPGPYRARICYGGLDKLSADGWEGEDRYRITLWPGSPEPLRVAKQRKPKTSQAM